MCRTHCSAKPPPYFRTSIPEINTLTNGHIRFEEIRGQIYVTMIDPYGDGHMFYLERDGLSKKQAIAQLQLKQEELDKKK